MGLIYHRIVDKLSIVVTLPGKKTSLGGPTCISTNRLHAKKFTMFIYDVRHDSAYITDPPPEVPVHPALSGREVILSFFREQENISSNRKDC